MTLAPSTSAVRSIIDAARASGRTLLSSTDSRTICEAYGIPVPGDALATSADEAAQLADGFGYPVVLKIASQDISHKTDAGGVLVGLSDAVAVREGYAAIVANAKSYNAGARIDGVQVQQMAPAGLEVLVGAVTDPSFGKIVAFGIGGVLVEVLSDVTFRLAPVNSDEAAAMLGSIKATALLDGVRGAPAVDKAALAGIVEKVGRIVTEHPEIAEMDLNPVFATASDAVAVDARIALDFAPKAPHRRPPPDEIVRAMNRIMKPNAVAVIGASAEAGKIGNSVMKNLINGGYEGNIYPIPPKATEIEGIQAYPSVKQVEGDIDMAVFAIPAALVPGALL